MTPKLSIFLKGYQAERQWFYQQLGKQLTSDDLVFASIEGNHIDPGVLTHAFNRIATRAGLSSVRFHDLRHTRFDLIVDL